MKLSDTHSHLHFDQYQNDIDAVVERARTANVQRILTLGTDLDSSLASLGIARNYDFIFAAVGIHPTDVLRAQPKDLLKIKEIAKMENKVLAIGEIGLDLYWKEVPLIKQIPMFEKMLDIAADLGYPVVIHNREAHVEMRKFFEDRFIRRLSGVMHSFSGTAEDAQFYLEKGLHISFTGVITFKNFKDFEVVKSVPLDRILLETDSPFLTPEPFRGKRNEPENVQFVAQRLADIYQIPREELSEVTYKNSARLFKWDII
jgi:TatD DNase family protein